MKDSFVPYDSLAIETPLSVQESEASLSRIVAAPPRSFRLLHARNSEKQFVGIVSCNGFKIYRAVKGRNSFLPTIKGRFSTLPTGTQVNITLSLHPLVIGILLIICIFIGGAAIGSLANGNVGRAALELGLLALGYCTGVVVFKWEANMAKRVLLAVLTFSEPRPPKSQNQT